jgi:hypothetical protein
MLIRYAILAALGAASVDSIASRESGEFRKSETPGAAGTAAAIFRRIAPSILLACPLNPAQVRNTLDRLEKERLVRDLSSRAKRSAPFPTRKGHEALTKWLRLPPARSRPLDSRLARVQTAAEFADPGFLIAICRRDIASLEQRQRWLRTSPCRDPDPTPATGHRLDYRAALLAMAIKEIEIEQKWLAEIVTAKSNLAGGRRPRQGKQART